MQRILLADAHAGDEAVAVLRTLIVALGGFCTVAAILLAAWVLLPLRRRCPDGDGKFASFLLGLLLLYSSGLAALTTDHIYKHLIANDAPAWQLWSALSTFTVGVVTLLSLIAVRIDRKTSR